MNSYWDDVSLALYAEWDAWLTEERAKHCMRVAKKRAKRRPRTLRK